MRGIMIIAVLTVIVLPVFADDRIPPVTNDSVKKECGACHMVFQPQLLPQRSWAAIMSGLDNHFGGSANMDEGDRREILGYLGAGAADVTLSRGGIKMMRGVKKDTTPMRITDLPRWRRKHSKDNFLTMINSARVKSKADCTACHPQAANGYYDDNHDEDHGEKGSDDDQ